MRHLLSGSIIALAAVWALPGQAAPILNVDYTAIPTDGAFFAPQATSSEGSYAEGVMGSVPNSSTSPFSDATTPYDSVGADGSALFGRPLLTSDIVRSAYTAGPPSSNFGSGSGTFSFVWGTPDTYNILSFYENGSLIGSVTGGSSPSFGDGTGSYLATVNGIGDYNTVVFQSVGKNAFEFAAVSPVPLPASLPMFGSAVLALGGLVMFRRGRAGAQVKAAN